MNQILRKHEFDDASIKIILEYIVATAKRIPRKTVVVYKYKIATYQDKDVILTLNRIHPLVVNKSYNLSAKYNVDNWNYFMNIPSCDNLVLLMNKLKYLQHHGTTFDALGHLDSFDNDLSMKYLYEKVMYLEIAENNRRHDLLQTVSNTIDNQNNKNVLPSEPEGDVENVDVENYVEE